MTEQSKLIDQMELTEWKEWNKCSSGNSDVDYANIFIYCYVLGNIIAHSDLKFLSPWDIQKSSSQKTNKKNTHYTKVKKEMSL